MVRITLVEQAADILANVSTDELVNKISEMRDTIRAYQDEYGVDSPEELTVEQTNQALSNIEAGPDEVDQAELCEWQTTRRNLAFANAALSIANAKRFVDGGPQSADESAPTL